MDPKEVADAQAVIVANPIVAVLVVDSAGDAVPLAEALLEEGVKSMELTLRTAAAVEALKAIKKNVTAMCAGVGTVIFKEQVAQIVEAGADFAVSPGFNPSVAEEALKRDLPFAPGVATPSDIEGAISLGFRVLKFFPAEPIGGLAYLQSMAAPYMHLGLRFVPLGGLNAGNLRSYLESRLIGAIGGSWIAPREAIRNGDWELIRSNAREAVRIMEEVRKVKA